MDGWVTISTKLNTKQLEKDIKDSERRLQQYEKEAEKLTQQKVNIKAKIEVDKKEYQKELTELKNEYKNTLNILKFENPKIPKATMERLDNELQQSLDKLNAKYPGLAEAQKELKEINKKLKENAYQQGLLNNQIDGMNKKLKQAKGIKTLNDELRNANSSMTGIIKKVTKWALAIFSVRSVYSFIRSSISTISQYNSQMATDIEYIRYALASSLQPVIERIITLVQTLLTYINYIWKAWTTHDLFASADAFKEAQKSTSGILKNVKEITKQFAGWDEMTVLQDQSSSDSGGASFGIPSFDLTSKDIPIPWWVDWIAKNKETVITIASVLGGLFAASTISKWLGNLGMLFGATGGQGLVGLLGTLGQIALIGGGIIITGYVAQKLIDDIEELKDEIVTVTEKTKIFQQQWIDDEEDINDLINTQNVRMKNGNDLLKKSSSWLHKILGLSESELAVVKGVIINSEAILDREMEIYKQGKLTDEQKKNLLKSIKDQIAYNNTIIELLDAQGVDTTELVRINDKYKNNLKIINDDLGISNNVLENIRNKNGKILEQEIEKYNQGKLTKQGQENLLNTLKSQYDTNNLIIARMKEMGLDTSTLEEENQKVKSSWEKIYEEVTGTKGKIDEIGKVKLNNKTLKIEVDADTSKAETGLQKLTNKMTGSLKKALGFSVGGVTYFANGGIAKFANGGINVAKPIKLAQGSIISQPGRGVPITRAIGGEAGAEGIVPLTNAQMMEQLGEAIGRYININLTNITKLDNRQIAREQRNINAQNDFATNR